MSYQPPAYPPQGAPNQGYPGAYPPNPGYPPQAPAQAPYPPAGYPPYQGQPQPGYAPGQQFSPYAQPAQQPRQLTFRSNQPAVRALLLGGLAIVVTIVGAFFGYVFVGGLSIFPIIYGVMGLIRAFRLPGCPGLFFAIGGIALGVVALLLTVILFIG